MSQLAAFPTPPLKGFREEQACAPFRQILVCLDGSGAAEASIALAARIAELDGACLTLLRVLEAPTAGCELRATDAIAWEIARDQARTYLWKLAQRLEAEGVLVETRLTEGPAPHEITGVAATISADLTVLSTHGEGGDGQWKLGSTARKVLELRNGALLLVPSHPRQNVARSAPLRRLLVPLDGSLRAEFALPRALRLARAENAELVAAHVSLDPIRTEMLCVEDDLALARELADRLEARADSYLESVCRRLASTGSPARKALARATDHRAGLVALAAREQPDLVVLSAHGSVCDTRHRFGSVTSYLIAHSPVPLLVLQDLPESGRAVTTPSTRPPPRSVNAAAGG